MIKDLFKKARYISVPLAQRVRKASEIDLPPDLYCLCSGCKKMVFSSKCQGKPKSFPIRVDNLSSVGISITSASIPISSRSWIIIVTKKSPHRPHSCIKHKRKMNIDKFTCFLSRIKRIFSK